MAEEEVEAVEVGVEAAVVAGVVEVTVLEEGATGRERMQEVKMLFLLPRQAAMDPKGRNENGLLSLMVARMLGLGTREFLLFRRKRRRQRLIHSWWCRWCCRCCRRW